MYYFDYAASCFTDKDVMDVFVEHELKYYPHPNTYGPSIVLRDETKQKIMKLLKIENKEIVFTSGGTEANNLAIFGFAKTLNKPAHFISTTYEHSSVNEPLEQLEKMGHTVTRVSARNDGRVHAEDVVAEIKEDTVFVSVMAVNNEIGVASDIELIASEVKKVNKGIVMFSDFVQGIGKTKLVNFKNIDLFTISSHKIYGLKSKGALIKNLDTKIEKMIYGGVLENNMRAGSQSVASEVAFAFALERSIGAIEANTKIIKENITYVASKLEIIEGIEINIMPDTNVLSIFIDGNIVGETFKQLLFNEGIVVSTKSACSFKVIKPNASLVCLGYDQKRSDNTIRISVSHHTTKADLDVLVEKIIKVKNTDC